MANSLSPTQASHVKSSRLTQSCTRCADRKVKCDRQRPCAACVKHNVDCVYNPLRPPRKRHRRVEILTDRLKQYEALLHEQGIDPKGLPLAPAVESSQNATIASMRSPENTLQTPSSIESEPSHDILRAHVVHGQGRSQIVENGLWTRVVEEFPDPEDALDSPSTDGSDGEEYIDDFSFVLGTKSKPGAKTRNPSPEHIHQLWQVFVERIDPLTKALHVPTVQPAIQKALANPLNVPRAFAALMFAVYSAAVMSLKEEECKEMFDESRKILLRRYISATKRALLRVKFMGTTSMVVLQALVIHLLSVRDIYEPRAVWSLTGVAIRIAQSMGVDRDGEPLGVPPFEVEIRRRVWWLLKTHDFRCAELCGIAKFRDLDTGPDSAKWPTNVNDNQIYPGMTSFPPTSAGVTDLIFIALRHEFSNFAAAKINKFRQQGKGPAQWNLHATGNDKEEIEEAQGHIDETVREVEELLETKYLRYCDPSQPLHLMGMMMARTALNNVRFLVHHPRRWASIQQTPLPERQMVWDISVKILKAHVMLQSNPLLRPFAWHASYFLTWHVLIHVLDTLRIDPYATDTTKAWQVVGELYDNNPDMISDTRKPVHVAVGNLCLKAYSAREVAYRSSLTAPLHTPRFISQLRQQHEVASIRRQMKEAKIPRNKKEIVDNSANLAGVSQVLGAGITVLTNPLSSMHLHQGTQSQSTTIPQLDDTVQDDQFWLINGFDDTQLGSFDDVMDMDPDFMFAQEFDIQNNVAQTINWEQWDTWMANSAVLPPLSSMQDFNTGT